MISLPQFCSSNKKVQENKKTGQIETGLESLPD